MKKFGFGFMRLPLVDGDFSRVDKATLCKMVDCFLDKGFQYFDTAWFYHDGQSEAAIKDCVVKRRHRSSFLLADKMPLVLVHQKEELEGYFTTQLRRCGVDYFDYYLIHDMGGDRVEAAEKLDIFSFLEKKKKMGLAGKIGFSFHDTADVLDRLLTEHPEVDFVQLQLNYLDWESPAIQSRECYETAKKHGKPVFVMEPVKGGTLASLPPEAERLLAALALERSMASWALGFAAGLENVQMVLSGMNTLEQVQENTTYMDSFQPFGKEELQALQNAGDIIRARTAIPCTGCAYCRNQCPMEIDIPKYFSLYNTDMQELKSKTWTPQELLYGHIIKQKGKPGDCVECGQCEEICPQHLPVRSWLKKVARHFGD